MTNRALPDRMVGVCRHYAVLHTALLRRQGTPARARVGFARYFGDGWVDHWITERWDGRWVRDDAQIGSVVQSALSLDFDPADQPPGEFLTGAEAWLRCRAGDADPQEFGIFDLRGLWFVRGNLVLDLAALNKVELLPWDSWDPRGPEWDPSDAELEAVDDLARAVIADDLAGNPGPVRGDARDPAHHDLRRRRAPTRRPGRSRQRRVATSGSRFAASDALIKGQSNERAGHDEERDIDERPRRSIGEITERREHRRGPDVAPRR